MVEKVIRKIKSLPPLPESVMKVREICNDPESTVKELIPIVKQDPMFTADILKAANSPLYGFSRQITSIDQAVSLFGMGTIQGFAISYAIRKSLPIDLTPYGASPAVFTRVSWLQNALTFQWGRPQIETYRSEIMTVSLLMELGKVVASMVLNEEGKTEEFKAAIIHAETMEEISAIEKSHLDITSEWIAALMFKHWQFNDILIEMMHHLLNVSEAPENIGKHTRILHVVKKAIPLTKPLCGPCVQSAYETAKRFGLDADTLAKAIETVEQA